MPVATATAILGGAAIAGGIGSSIIGAQSSSKAASAQRSAADAGIAEQQRQFEAVKELLAPFVEGGEDAFGVQMLLAGLGDQSEQQGVIEDIQGSPEYEALIREGEDAILANASATGGLRGGNVQRALSKYRPDVLASLIDKRYARLGGLASMGQASAAFTGQQGIATGQSIADLRQQAGAATAGGALARGYAYQDGIDTLTKGLGYFGKQAKIF